MEKNHLYYWRNIPHTQFCVVSADSLRPSTIRDVAVTDISFNRTDGTLGLRIEITPPEVYGVLLSMYEVLLGDQTFLVHNYYYNLAACMEGTYYYNHVACMEGTYYYNLAACILPC